ncbi:MAG: hypothetical protein ACRC6A_10230, partial [Fusobacteriaceae bacterium]
QVCYEFASLSSEYQVDFNVDINIVKDRYNELVKDVKEIFNYVKTNMITSDGLDVSIVLPQLDLGEVWMRTEEGYKGFNVSDIEANIASFREEFARITKEALDQVQAEGNKQTDIVTDIGKVQVDRINATASTVDNRLEAVWRMYSILTGSQRYLSGNVLTQRNVIGIEKTVDGGKLSERVGEPKRLYTGNSIADRALPRLNVLDLGEAL